jgi:uncharacterized protein YjiS (DUF1127 family)
MTAQTVLAHLHLRPLVAARHVLVRLGDAAMALRQAWYLANRSAASRRNLGRLDDRMLADIGISAAQAEYEATRWG